MIVIKFIFFFIIAYIIFEFVFLCINHVLELSIKRKQRELELEMEFRKILGQLFEERAKGIKNSNRQSQCPVSEFKVLGLPQTSSEDQIKKQYRILAHKHHPDKGGTKEQFNSIVHAKNKCLEYVQNKKIQA